MDDTGTLSALLNRAADVPGGPISVSGPLLVSAARRRTRRRRLVAVSSVAAGAVLVVATTAALTGHNTVAQPAGPSAVQIARGHWSTLPASPVPGRSFAASAWTGQLMVVWGGASVGIGQLPVVRSDGASYDPVTHQWAVLPRSPLGPRAFAASAWTGKELFVWGGASASTPNGDSVSTSGALYDPARRTWRMIAPGPLSGRESAQAFWTGSAVLVIGGRAPLTGTSKTAPAEDLDGALYDPATDRWTTVPSVPLVAGHPIYSLVVGVAAGHTYAFAIWDTTSISAGGVVTQTSSGGVDLSVLDARTDRWAGPTTWTHSMSQPLSMAAGLLLPAGNFSADRAARGGIPIGLRGGILDARTGAWRLIAHGPVDDDVAQSAWTGRALISFNSQGSEGNVALGSAAVWDPAADRWTSLPRAPALAELGSPAVWTGKELLVWGQPADPANAPVAKDRPAVGLQFGG
ncbi:MAG TPA: hypothetical protein VIJ54_01680 [Actinomycetes bacterium]